MMLISKLKNCFADFLQKGPGSLFSLFSVFYPKLSSPSANYIYNQCINVRVVPYHVTLARKRIRVLL